MSSAEIEDLRARISLCEHQLRAIDQRTRNMMEAMARLEDKVGELHLRLDARHLDPALTIV